MSIARFAPDHVWTAEALLATDQHDLGDAWRHELVNGAVVAHADPAPDHGAVIAGLIGALATRLRGRPGGCRPEGGSGAIPAFRQRATARIPDVMIRCGEHPVVLFEIISPSEIRHWRKRDRKRHDLQDTEGAKEIVEIYPTEPAMHVYRKPADGIWAFEALDGIGTILHLTSVGLDIPLPEIYQFVTLDETGQPPETGEPPC
jgi:Uma2 family endonuclease